MLNLFIASALVVFFSAIVVHLATRLFLGPRADNLPGGALAFAFFKSASFAREHDILTVGIFVGCMLIVALAGHFLSAHVVSTKFPNFGRKSKQ